MTRSGSWSYQKLAASLAGTLASASRARASLTTKVAGPSAMRLVASTCPTCGSVRVMYGTKVVATVSLRSPSVQNRRVFALPSFTAVRAGAVKFVAVGNGKVSVDGLVVSRAP